MAEAQKFRSAFNGFNREDVVHYIQFINTRHTGELNQLRTQLKAQEEELQALRAVPAEDPEKLQNLQLAVEALNKELNTALSRSKEQEARFQDQAEALCAAEEQIKGLNEKCAVLAAALKLAEDQRDTALSQMQAARDRSEQELEAYRRAERTERLAKERAQQLYHQANGALADASAKVDEAAAQISQISDSVCSQLSALQTAVTGSKQALQDAAGSLYSIRVEKEDA